MNARPDVPLNSGESVLAALELDLDARLNFARGHVLVTERRLMAKAADDGEWKEWLYVPGLKIHHHDHAGVGTLELADERQRLACWRYTLGHNPDALRLIREFNEQCQAVVASRARVAAEDRTCPSCGGVIAADQEDCPACSSENLAPPSTWTLFRLWRFAHPYRGQLLAGFLLTLAATAATLVPPYLTMPLMDNVLIPYQNGAPIDVAQVTFSRW
jgi:ATP-binding cassette subfamily B protein